MWMLIRAGNFFDTDSDPSDSKKKVSKKLDLKF